jgi:hypothetical protein
MAAEFIVPGVRTNLGGGLFPAATYNARRAAFFAHLEAKQPRAATHRYNHPGLNGRYGIEIEFASSANRYVIGNRVNSCMWSKNNKWWRSNFNPLGGDVPAVLTTAAGNPIGTRPLRYDPGAADYNQWSSFFLEVSNNHGSVSHRGDELWSNRSNEGHINTDIRGAGDFFATFSGLRADNSTFVVDEPFTLHTLNFGGQWRNDPADPWRNLSFWNGNELVSNVLTNQYVTYPFVRMEGGVTAPGSVPVGSILLDNALNHMRGHGTVLCTQNMGFHVHISEWPRIPNNADGSISAARKRMIIGFVKLFYFFEPLLFSFHPPYRAESDYTQSLQSLLSLVEVRGFTVNNLWNALMDDAGLLAPRRLREGARYAALNITNCAPGGIGTIEIRLGHSTFDSDYIQAYVNLLQTLLELNIALMNYDAAVDNGLHATHNSLLNSTLVPYYCGSANYDVAPGFEYYQIHAGNNGRPIRGFFNACGFTATGRAYKSNIILALLQTFEAFTGSYDMLEYLVENGTRAYHTFASSWLRRNHINDIDFYPAMRGIHAYLGHMSAPGSVVGSQRFNEADGSTNAWEAIRTGNFVGGYWVSAAGPGILHACKTCSSDIYGNCGVNYGDGDYPVNVDGERPVAPGTPRLRALSNESRLYRKICDDGRRIRNKLQTELIDWKSSSESIGPIGHAMTQFGGSRTRKLRESSNNILRTRNTTMTPDELQAQYERTYKVNRESDPVILSKTGDMYTAGYTDWVGNFIKDDNLTQIINALLSRKIVNEELLGMLEDNKYLGLDIFLNSSELHKRKLVEALSKFKIKEDTINEIRKVYEEFRPTSTSSSWNNPATNMAGKAMRQTRAQCPPFPIEELYEQQYLRPVKCGETKQFVKRADS